MWFLSHRRSTLGHNNCSRWSSLTSLTHLETKGWLLNPWDRPEGPTLFKSSQTKSERILSHNGSYKSSGNSSHWVRQVNWKNGKWRMTVSGSYPKGLLCVYARACVCVVFSLGTRWTSTGYQLNSFVISCSQPRNWSHEWGSAFSCHVSSLILFIRAEFGVCL